MGYNVYHEKWVLDLPMYDEQAGETAQFFTLYNVHCTYCIQHLFSKYILQRIKIECRQRVYINTIKDFFTFKLPKR